MKTGTAVSLILALIILALVVVAAVLLFGRRREKFDALFGQSYLHMPFRYRPHCAGQLWDVSTPYHRRLCTGLTKGEMPSIETDAYTVSRVDFPVTSPYGHNCGC